MRKIINFLFPKKTAIKPPLFQLGDFFRVEQVDTVPQSINELFQKKFGDSAPLEPLHFVASYKLANGNWLPMGYVHYGQFDDCYLCGGLVIDEMSYRQMTKSQREQIKQQDGVGSMLIGKGVTMLPENTAVWAYSGVLRSRNICYEAGFVDAGHPYLMVSWQKQLTEAEKAKYIEKFIAIGPF